MAKLGHLNVFILIFIIYHIKIVSLSPPKLLPIQNTINLAENMTFTLFCSLLSGSDIHFEWMHNNSKLSNNSQHKLENLPELSLLKFQSIQKHHSGFYECRATNSIGQFDIIKTTINVQGNLNLLFQTVCGANLLKKSKF